MKKSKLLMLAVLAASAWVLCGPSGSALAATRTWIGTDCPTTDCLWSNSNNWQGGSIPANGDDVVIAGSAVSPDASYMTYNDIQNLTLNSLAVSGYSNSSNPQVLYVAIAASVSNTTPLTINGDITYTTPTAAAPSGWSKATGLDLDQDIVLGGNATFTQVRLGDNLNLNGHALTYLRTLADQGTSGTTVNFESLITGNGTLNINVPTTAALYMNSANTYSGTTNINTVDYVTSIDVIDTGIFGTSTINLSAQSRVLFSGNGSLTINNVINVTPPAVTGTFLDNQLEFWSSGGAVTYTVPNIRLLGNARFGINDGSGTTTVNLAGITTNGHCIQYGTDNFYASSFQNGPAACVVAVTTQNVPKAPDTGVRLLTTNPFVVALATLTCAAGLLASARYMSHRQASKR